MKLIRARIQKYRSIRDTGFFEIEPRKTILVGPNEAGKPAILQALQQINPPEGVKPLDALRDYPRSEYDDILRGVVSPYDVTVVEGHFLIEKIDIPGISLELEGETLRVCRRLDNTVTYHLMGGPDYPTIESIEDDLLRMAAHVDGKVSQPEPPATLTLPGKELDLILEKYARREPISGDAKADLEKWLKSKFPLIEEGSTKEEERYKSIRAALQTCSDLDAALLVLSTKVPKFVLYSNYFRVRPILHLEHLADRLEKNLLDDDSYDYGNKCLLQLLGFSARDLSNLGKASEPAGGDSEAWGIYRAQLDQRSYQLNAASVHLTKEIVQVWAPEEKKSEAARLKISADGQYLKVVVEDSLGVEVELDQRSEGFQWLVSFFVVFFAESKGINENAILLLDEPGLHLHALKQKEFRNTISRLSEKNQTLYTTHSPFLVGPEELDLVRVVEMVDREKGTAVHGDLLAADSAALLPLQEALGYDLAQSLFAAQRNLICEGLTDFWYIEGVSQLLAEADIAKLDERIALVPASSAGKIVYFATILHAHKLRVVALLDSDAAGDQAAKQDTLVHTLGNGRILRTKDFYKGDSEHPEVEDLLCDTLLKIGKDLGWDIGAKFRAQPKRPIVNTFSDEANFSKYKLAKAFLRWTRDHSAADLSESERAQWKLLIAKINSSLK